MRRTKVNIGMNVSFYMFLTIGYCFTIIWGAYRVSTGFYTMGTLVAVMELVSSIQMPLRSVSSVIPQYYQMIASGERLLEIKSMDRDNKNETDTKHFEKNFKEMRIENLCFDYEEQKVFENLNVRIAKGERLLISGESGIGKSTLVKLLLGYEIPRKGSIALICGDRQFFAGKDTRNLISFMPQGNMLFSGSIKDNILFGEEEDKEKLSKALELACVDFTDSLPMGLETHLGENGLGLSQGQGQRISLARTLYSDREVLLLDEPTSALDSQTQEKILNNLKGIGKTIIIISHKKETEGFADKILRM